MASNFCDEQFIDCINNGQQNMLKDKPKSKCRACSVKITPSNAEYRSVLENSRKRQLDFSDIAKDYRSNRKKEKKSYSVVDSQIRTINQSLKGSMAASVKKQKKRPPLARITEHETPVLGKYSHEGPHFMTVGELQSADPGERDKSVVISQANVPLSGSPMKQYSEQSRLNVPLTNAKERQQYGVQVQKSMMPMPLEVQKKLDQTIGKLRSKQQTIQILNKTIQTKLHQVVAESNKSPKYTNRMDAYQVEINFYIDKISQLQKELYQKNKIVKTLTSKNMDYETITKNNKKLIMQNGRLRDEREMLERQNLVLKKIVNKKQEKML